MDTRLAKGDLQSQLAVSRAKTATLAAKQEAAESRAHSLLNASHAPSPGGDGTIDWSTVLENDVTRHEVGTADLGLGEMTEEYALDVENGVTVLCHKGLVVLGSCSDVIERRRRRGGVRTWRSGDAVELLEGLWRGVMGCFRGLFSVVGVRMENSEERTPLVEV